MRPDFFAAEPIRKMLNIRVQRGSDLEMTSDGLSMFVRDADEIRQNQIGQPLDLNNQLSDDNPPEPPVTLTLYLNRSCPPKRDKNPVVLLSLAGTVIFRGIYAPNIDKKDLEIAASLRDVRVAEPSSPETIYAVVNGDFRFLFVRGRPAQTYPSP